MSRLAILLLTVGWTGCGGGSGPAFEGIMPITGLVGEEVRIPLRANAPGGRVSFDFASPDLPDLKTRRQAASVIAYAGNSALFRWLPIAADVGAHELDFIASANNQTSIYPVAITIVAGPGAAPVFRTPVGEGSTLDLGRSPCAELEVLVEDPDQTEVTLALEAPVPPSAMLNQTGPFAASLRFCPSEAQIAAATIYPLTLSADDRVLPRVLKPYTIVVRPPTGMGCITKAPTITATPRGDVVTAGNLYLVANIADDVAVTSTRLLWTLTAPANPKTPDLTGFAPILMPRKRGDGRQGDYEGVIPNPVVNAPAGTSKRIYYVIEATDDDPGGCGHRTLAPSSGTYSFVVKRP